MEVTKEIQGFGELRDAYGEEFKKAQVEFKRLMDRMAELTPQIPKIAQDMISRGLENQKNRIDADFREIDSLISERFDANGEAQLKREVDQEWVNENSGRSKMVTGAVTNVKNMSTQTRTAAVSAAVRVTSVVGKGLALFGQKGLAKRMQESVIERGKDYISRDSRASRIVQRVAERGFKVADGARNVERTVVSTIDDVAQRVGTAAINTTENIIGGIGNYIKDTREGMSDVREQTDLNYMNLGSEVSRQNQEARQWQNAHEDRNAEITGAVKGINETSLGVKAVLAQGKIKLMSFAAKGVALTGRKGLAREIASKGFNSEKNTISKGSRVGKFAERIASTMFKQSDNFREGVDNAKEMAGAYVSAGVQTVKDARESVRDGVLEFGRSHYMGAAKVAAIATLPLTLAGAGIEYSAGKLSNGIDFVSGKAIEGIEFVSDKVEDVKEALHLTGEKIKLAADKVSRNKAQAQKGIKTFFRDMAASVVGRLDKSITRDDDRISQKSVAIESRQAEIEEKDDSGER